MIVNKGDGSDKATESTDGAGLVREVIDEVSEGGEVVKGTIRLVPVIPKNPVSSEDATVADASSKESGDGGQSSIPDIPSSKTKGGTAHVPNGWANVWTTNDRVELWV